MQVFAVGGKRRRRIGAIVRHVRVVRLITNPVVLRRLLRLPSTEASSLHRHYPASSVLQASPPPQTARPVSRELPVDPLAIAAGASRVAFSPLCLHAVATTPAGWRKLFAHTLPPRRPSPTPRRVGTCIMDFEACSAFTHVTACTLAESPLRPSSTGGSSSFVTSTAAPIATGRNEPVPGWDLHPLWTKRLSRRTRTIPLVTSSITLRCGCRSTSYFRLGGYPTGVSSTSAWSLPKGHLSTLFF